MKITATERPIMKIFSDDFVFDIPSYQRPYSWTSEEAKALLQDLLDSLGDIDDPYFLGSIVLAKEDGIPASKVIDGQQRLTTITILLAALASFLPDDEAEALRQFLRQKGNLFADIGDTWRLTLRPRDAAFFRKYVQNPESLDSLIMLDSAQLDNDAKRNVRAVAKLFVEELATLDVAARFRLGKFLVSGCYLVTVSTPDRDSAYRIFAILNDRGLDLSHADIFKSEVIGTIADDDLEETYTRRWEDTQDALGTEPFKDLFSHILMIYTHDKLRGSILKEFRSRVLSRHLDDPCAFVDKVVVPYGDLYARIRTQSWESEAQSEEINRWLERLGRIDNVDWVPPAIRYLHTHRNDHGRIARFLERLERLAATMYVRRFGVNERIGRYGDLLKEIEKHDDILDSGSSLDLSNQEKEATLVRLDGEVYLDKPARYVLMRLEEARSAGGVKFEHKVISVEHVLPQGPHLDSEWRKLFSDKQRLYWTHRLANLLLLPIRKNRDAQNYDFGKKKNAYFSKDGKAAPFLITMDVLSHSTWTPAVLETRQKEALETLAVMWQLS